MPDAVLVRCLRLYEMSLRKFGLFDAADFARQLGDLMTDPRYGGLPTQVSSCQLPWETKPAHNLSLWLDLTQSELLAARSRRYGAGM